MSGYRKALPCIEEACQLAPKNGDFLNTLGVAYYRVGNYEKALDMLARATKIHALRDKGSHHKDLAFLAMAHQQLGHAKEADAELQLLRGRMKDPGDATIPGSGLSARWKNCWQNRSCRAPSKQAWAFRIKVQACPCGIETARLLRRAGYGPSAPNHGLSAEGVRFG